MSNRRPSIPLGNIPSTRDLCDFLGFYGTDAKNDLCNFSRKWRMTYTTSSGRPGTTLLNWKSEQEELKIMAKAFLSDAVEQTFWLSRKGGDSMSGSSNEETANLLMQLCWKQNKYAHNNAKYPPPQRRIRCMGETEYNNERQIKRRKIAGDTLVAWSHDRLMVLDTEQYPPSQQFSTAPPPLEPRQTDAAALPPTESQLPPLVQHKSALTTRPKGRILIPFHTLLHTNGVTRQSFWEDGRFGSKSLKEFLPGLAVKLECELSDIEKIKLVLRLETREVDFEMEARREDIWDIAIATFRNETKGAREPGELRRVSVLVEPVMRKDNAETRGRDEDEEFEL